MHDWEEKRNGACLNVGEEEIADVVSSWTKIPVSKIAEAESERLMKLEETLHKRVIGQDEAVSSIQPRANTKVPEPVKARKTVCNL